ncbi:MAG: hypothetical protein BMS9Abin07_2132 [Acidimicrobiia bacterium]|nr:MAG: hypothetical protein BMS9Abin07_2132 [Acidimicrobiia bacterium]
MRKVTLGIALLLVMSACSSGGDGDPATTAGSAGQATTPTSASSSGGDGGGTPSADAPGADSDFCLLLDDIEQEQDVIFDLTPDTLEEAMNNTLEFADQAAAIAPSELEDAVDTLFSGFADFVNALADIDYDPFTNQAAFLEDPRVMYLDSAEYTEAGAAVDEYCGDSPDTGTVGPPSSIPGGGTVPPSGGSSADLPDAFPDDLVPPGVTNVESISAGGVFSVTFTSDASFDDVVAFFTDAVGPAVSNIEAGAVRTAQWVPGGNLTTIIVVEEEGTVTAFVAGTG